MAATAARYLLQAAKNLQAPRQAMAYAKATRGIQSLPRPPYVTQGKRLDLRPITRAALPAFLGSRLSKSNNNNNNNNISNTSVSRNVSRTQRVFTNGSYAGKIRMPKRLLKRKIKFPKAVAIFKQENRGSETDTHAVYIGHGVAPNKLVLGCIQTVVYYLFKKAGVNIQSWNDPLSQYLSNASSYRINYKYRASRLATTLTSVDVALSPLTDTFYELCYDLINSIASNFGTTASAPIMTEIRLIERNTAAAADALIIRANINPDLFKIQATFFSTMTVQNKTLAGLTTDTGDQAANNELSTEITSNPLYCKVYERSGNCFIPRHRVLETDASYEGFTAHKDTGLISTTATDSLPEEGKEPSNGLFIGVPKPRSAVFEPGQIRKMNMKAVKAMSLNSWLSMLQIYFDTDANIDTLNFGKVQMLGCEKMLQVSANENPILVGYEINQSYYFSYYFKESTTPAPYTNIN